MAPTTVGNFTALVVRARGVEPDPGDVGSGCEVDALVGGAGRELDAAPVFRGWKSLEMWR